MLRCWDSDPEDRPTFAKIAITISKALQIMSDYLDLSMIGNKMQYTQNGNQEPAFVSQQQYAFSLFSVENVLQAYMFQLLLSTELDLTAHDPYMHNNSSTV